MPRWRSNSISTALIRSDILDVNAGSHGKYFATNFDPEINFREFTGQVWSWQNSQWTSNTMFEVKRTDDLPVVGSQNLYLTPPDEVHSLSKNLDVPNVRFWMSFGEHYINVFTVLNSLGLLSEKPVTTAEGLQVVPLKVGQGRAARPVFARPRLHRQDLHRRPGQRHQGRPAARGVIYNVGRS